MCVEPRPIVDKKVREANSRAVVGDYHVNHDTTLPNRIRMNPHSHSNSNSNSTPTHTHTHTPCVYERNASTQPHRFYSLIYIYTLQTKNKNQVLIINKTKQRPYLTDSQTTLSLSLSLSHFPDDTHSHI